MIHHRISNLLSRVYINSYLDLELLDNAIVKLPFEEKIGVCKNMQQFSTEKSIILMISVLSKRKLDYIFKDLLLNILAHTHEAKTNPYIVKFIKNNYSNKDYIKFMKLLSNEIRFGEEIIFLVEGHSFDNSISLLEAIVFNQLPVQSRAKIFKRLSLPQFISSTLEGRKIQSCLYTVLEHNFKQTYTAIKIILE